MTSLVIIPRQSWRLKHKQANCLLNRPARACDNDTKFSTLLLTRRQYKTRLRNTAVSNTFSGYPTMVLSLCEKQSEPTHTYSFLLKTGKLGLKKKELFPAFYLVVIV